MTGSGNRNGDRPGTVESAMAIANIEQTHAPELTFDFDGAIVRVVMIEGEPWFVASDAAKALGYRDAAAGTRMLRDHQRRYTEVCTSAGMRRVLVVNEAGLNRMVLRSNREEAERFQDWLAEDVIPSIRRTGNYARAAAPTTPPQLPEMPDHIEALRGWADSLERQRALTAEVQVLEVKVVETQAIVDEREKEITALQPKAEAWETMIDPDQDYTIDDAAKHMCRSGDIEIGEHRLFKWMREREHIFKKEDRGRKYDMPYQRHIDAGRLSVKIGDRFWNEKNRKYEQGASQVRIPGRALAYWLKALRRDGRFAKKSRQRQLALVEADP
jgi:anti-repressor protein